MLQADEMKQIIYLDKVYIIAYRPIVMHQGIENDMRIVVSSILFIFIWIVREDVWQGVITINVIVTVVD